MSIDNFTGADEFDVDSFLDGNARSAFKKKDGVPHELTGTITMIKPAAPVKDYDTGEIKCYPGTTDVIKQLPVVVSTAERDPEVIGDNGDRTIYFDGDLLKALRAAVKLSGAKLRVGGTLWVKKTQGPSPKTGNTKNFWEVTYAPAAGRNRRRRRTARNAVRAHRPDRSHDPAAHTGRVDRREARRRPGHPHEHGHRRRPRHEVRHRREGRPRHQEHEQGAGRRRRSRRPVERAPDGILTGP